MYYKFYSASKYYGCLAEKIVRSRKGDRVILFSLWLKPEEPAVARVLEAANAAAQRGAEVWLVADAFTFLIKNGLTPGPAFYFGNLPPVMPKAFEVIRDALKRLQQHGGRCAIINEPEWPRHVMPFMGRSHVKFSIVNDHDFVGGCNLAESDFIDVMVGWKDKRTADKLQALTDQIIRQGSVVNALGGQDLQLPIDKKTTLLIDAGRPGRSLILDSALQMIDNAKKHLLITYQYYPQSLTASHLRLAHEQGVELKIIYNHPAAHTMPINFWLYVASWSVRQQSPSSFSTHRLPRGHNYMHAKLIASERGALVGSHNFMMSGVRLGTAEIAILSRSHRFAARAVKTLKKQIN